MALFITHWTHSSLLSLLCIFGGNCAAQQSNNAVGSSGLRLLSNKIPVNKQIEVSNVPN